MRLLALISAALLAGPALAGPILDPSGDTVGGYTPGVDIVNSPGFVNIGGGIYQLTVNFAGPITAPSAFDVSGNGVGGFIDLDLDRNPLTGAVPWTSFFVSGPLNLGSEAYISLFDEFGTPGLVGLYDANTFALLGQLAISFGPNSFTLTLPGSLIGNVSAFNYALVSIPSSGVGLDRAPNGAVPFDTVVPEPTTLAVVGLVLGGAFAARRRKAAVSA